jgi:hypothetical protein
MITSLPDFLPKFRVPAVQIVASATEWGSVVFVIRPIFGLWSDVMDFHLVPSVLTQQQVKFAFLLTLSFICSEKAISVPR